MLRKTSFIILFGYILLALTACNPSTQATVPDTELLSNSQVVKTVSAQTATLETLTQATTPVQTIASGAELLSNNQMPNTEGAQTSDLESIQLPSGLTGKISAVSPDGDGSVTIMISDDELTQAIAKAQQALIDRGQTPIFQSAVFRFTSSQIFFSSTIDSERFSGDLEILFTPYLTGNVLQFELVSATVNGRPIPATAMQPVEDTLNQTLGEIFSKLPPSVSLNEVTIQEGSLTITGSVSP